MVPDPNPPQGAMSAHSGLGYFGLNGQSKPLGTA